MTDKRSIYDTDPLDEDFLRQTEALRESGETRKFGSNSKNNSDAYNNNGDAYNRARQSSSSSRRGGDMPPTFADSEAPTQRFYRDFSNDFGTAEDARNLTREFAASSTAEERAHYNSSSSNHRADNDNPKLNRNVAPFGMPENLLTTIVYAPLFFGLIAAIIELGLTPRTEGRVRFHAAQSAVLHLGVMALGSIFQILKNLTGFALGGFGAFLFGLATFILTTASVVFFIVMMVRAWNGEAKPINQLAEATRWLNEKIEPQK